MKYDEFIDFCLGIYTCRPCDNNTTPPNNIEKCFQYTLCCCCCISCGTAAGAGIGFGLTTCTSAAYSIPSVCATIGCINGVSIASIGIFKRPKQSLNYQSIEEADQTTLSYQTNPSLA